jgi:hypothetical protein
MIHPIVCIFTKKGCPACTMTMKNYGALERDIKNMSPETEIRVIAYGNDWKTRIYEVEEYKNLKNIDITKPGPPISSLNFAPMFAIVRSDQMNSLEKMKVNGAKLQPKQRVFTQSEKPENIRTWLIKNLKEIKEDIANGDTRPLVNYNKNKIDIESEKKKLSDSLYKIKAKKMEKQKPNADKKYFFQMVGLDD